MMRNGLRALRATSLAALALSILGCASSCGSNAAGHSREDENAERPNTWDALPNAEPAIASGLAAEDVWLNEIGNGPSQTSRVCQSGLQDRVISALCAQPAPVISSLRDLYAALGFVGEQERSVATATHSLGLSARSVSAANPRTVVFVNTGYYGAPVPYEKLAAMTFARGEQLVELVALDTATFEWNFYLLRFEQACNASRCTPEQLLTEKIENDWTGWTLYSDAQLEDTPLDCISCHQPFGKGSHKMLLMRQMPDPWMHWGDFRGVDETDDCSRTVERNMPGRHIHGEGLDLLLKLEGANGRHAGIDVTELHAAESGVTLALLLVDAELTVRQSPYQPNDYLYEQMEFSSARTLCERLKTGTSPTWDSFRSQLASQGLPVPFYEPDVLDPAKREEFAADRAAYLARHADADALDVARDLLKPAVAPASGFVPQRGDSAPEILRQMCIRCHAKTTPPHLQRAGFNAENLERIDPDTARAVRTRIHLPRTSPAVMPPLRAGELPYWALARIETYLKEHCSDPTPGACD